MTTITIMGCDTRRQITCIKSTLQVLTKDKLFKNKALLQYKLDELEERITKVVEEYFPGGHIEIETEDHHHAIDKFLSVRSLL